VFRGGYSQTWLTKIIIILIVQKHTLNFDYGPLGACFHLCYHWKKKMQNIYIFITWKREVIKLEK